MEKIREILENLNVGNLRDGDVALSDVCDKEFIDQALSEIEAVIAERESQLGEVLDDILYLANVTEHIKTKIKAILKAQDEKRKG